MPLPSARLPWLLALAVAIASCEPDASLEGEGRRRGVDADPGVPARPRGSESPAAVPEPAAAGPPELGRPEVTVAVDCVRVVLMATRPVTATAVFAVAGARRSFALGAGATLFDDAFRVGGPSGPASVEVVAQAGDGGTLTTPPIDFMAPATAGTLVITEVLANPAGPETSQEYVELMNLGSAPASTSGLRIEDGRGADPLPAASLPAGARALVVGGGFDEQSPLDVPPRAGTLLLRVPGRIGRDGLGQAGEPVRLVAASGAVQSSYGGWVDVHAPAWAGRSVHRVPAPGACDHPRAWSSAPLPPTPGW